MAWVAAVVQIQSPAQEVPHATEVAKKKKGPNSSHLNFFSQSSCRGAVETNSTRNHDVAGLIPGLTLWVKDLALPLAVV